MKNSTLIAVMTSFLIANSVSSYIITKITVKNMIECHFEKNSNDEGIDSKKMKLSTMYNKKMHQEIMSFIHNNSEEIISELQNGQMENEVKKRKSVFLENYEKYRSDIFSEKRTTYIGKKNASRKMAIFLDYSCGYCKKIAYYPKEILKKFPDTEIQIIELPLFNPKNAEYTYSLSRVISTIHHEKYQEFFEILLTNTFNTSQQKNLEILEKIGVKKETVEKEIEELTSNLIQNELQENYQIAGALGVNGTPSFIINDELIVGAIPLEQLLNIIDTDNGDKKN